jgi:hypothetical protein
LLAAVDPLNSLAIEGQRTVEAAEFHSLQRRAGVGEILNQIEIPV